MEKEIKFKEFSEVMEEIGWIFSSNRPIGQQWKCHDGFCTNGRGVGFKLHGGTNLEEICKLIDHINQQDVEIALLKIKLKKIHNK